MGTLKKFNDKCENLTLLHKQFSFTTMIETGCFKGDSIEYASRFKFLKSIYSCDIEPTYVEHCLNRFGSDSRISIQQQDSHEFLETILPKLFQENSILFWLDAHFHKLAAFPEYNDTDYPLVKELEIIQRHRSTNNDVIVIDDVYTYVDRPKNFKVPFKIPTVGLNFLNEYGYTYRLYQTDKGYLMLNNTRTTFDRA